MIPENQINRLDHNLLDSLALERHSALLLFTSKVNYRAIFNRSGTLLLDI